MATNDVIKDLIVQRVNSGVIRLEALKAGMMADTVIILGLLPILFSTGTGSEVMKSLSTPDSFVQKSLRKRISKKTTWELTSAE